MKGKEVVVSGGAGFIGSWLCQRLIQEGYRVTCLDNLHTGRRNNIARLDLKFIEHDIRKPLKLKTDYVFHLASRASPVDFTKCPLEILTTGSEGTYNMLDIAKENGARFLLSSTSEVYGEPQKHPQSEDYWGNVNSVGVRSCYDEAKRFAEALTVAFRREHGLDIRIARIFNTYGERMTENDGRVIPNFVNQALLGQPITVYGDGSQTRSFCYVSDMVEGLMRLMFTENVAGEVINLGNPHETKVIELAQMVKRLVGSSSEIIFRPLPQDDPTRRRPDISRARSKLKWEPAVPLEEGLHHTINYFRELPKG